jgi:hypothetical protein
MSDSIIKKLIASLLSSNHLNEAVTLAQNLKERTCNLEYDFLGLIFVEVD